MEKREVRQRRLYADHRMLEAIDRLLEAKTDLEKKKASKWARAWRDFSVGRNRHAVSLSALNRQWQEGSVSECGITLGQSITIDIFSNEPALDAAPGRR